MLHKVEDLETGLVFFILLLFYPMGVVSMVRYGYNDYVMIQVHLDPFTCLETKGNGRNFIFSDTD